MEASILSQISDPCVTGCVIARTDDQTSSWRAKILITHSESYTINSTRHRSQLLRLKERKHVISQLRMEESSLRSKSTKPE